MERRNRHTKKPANRFAGFRVVTGAPGEIRTPDPQVRSLVLYPAELRARMKQKRNFAGIPAVPSISAISLGRSLGHAPRFLQGMERGRAASRGRVWTYVVLPVVAGSLKKKNTT